MKAMLKNNAVYILGLALAAYGGFIFGLFRLNPIIPVIIPAVFVFGMGLRKARGEIRKNDARESGL